MSKKNVFDGMHGKSRYELLFHGFFGMLHLRCVNFDLFSHDYIKNYLLVAFYCCFNRINFVYIFVSRK